MAFADTLGKLTESLLTSSKKDVDEEHDFISFREVDTIEELAEVLEKSVDVILEKQDNFIQYQLKVNDALIQKLNYVIQRIQPTDLTTRGQTYRYDPLAPKGQQVTTLTASGKAGLPAPKSDAAAVLRKAAYLGAPQNLDQPMQQTPSLSTSNETLTERFKRLERISFEEEETPLAELKKDTNDNFKEVFDEIDDLKSMIDEDEDSMIDSLSDMGSKIFSMQTAMVAMGTVLAGLGVPLAPVLTMLKSGEIRNQRQKEGLKAAGIETESTQGRGGTWDTTLIMGTNRVKEDSEEFKKLPEEIRTLYAMSALINRDPETGIYDQEQIKGGHFPGGDSASSVDLRNKMMALLEKYGEKGPTVDDLKRNYPTAFLSLEQRQEKGLREILDRRETDQAAYDAGTLTIDQIIEQAKKSIKWGDRSTFDKLPQLLAQDFETFEKAIKEEGVRQDISHLEKGQSRDKADALLFQRFNIEHPSLSSAAPSVTPSTKGKAGSPHITERVLKDGNRQVTSLYGMRTLRGKEKHHSGIDIAGKIGDPIFAYDSGTVKVGSDTTRGKFVDLKLNNGYKVGYSHLSSIDVEEGQVVEVGDRIGALGNTGYSTGPHLHFSVRQKDGTFVNPDVLASLYTGPADETTTPMDANSMDERVASTPASTPTSTAPAAAPTVLPEITVAATKTNDASSIAFSQEQQGQHPFLMVNAPQTYSMQQPGQKQDVGPPITVTDTDPSNRFSQSRDRWFSSYFS